MSPAARRFEKREEEAATMAAAAAAASGGSDHDGRTPRTAVVAIPRAPATTPAAVFALTYLTWASIHAARKSYSVVKPTLLEEEWLTTPLLDGVAAKGALSAAERLSVPDTCFFLAFALSTLWKGAISDRGDPRVIMASALAGCSLLLALFGLGYYARVHPVLYFGLLWALQAFGQALVWPAAVRVMGDWFKGEGTRSVVMGLWCSSNNIGNIVGTGVGALSSVALGSHAWGAPMLALALLLLAVSWIVFGRLTPTPRLVGRAPYRGSVGAKEELVEAFGATGLLDDEEGGEGEEEQEEEDEEETVIAFGPASPMVRPGDGVGDGGWEERRRPLLEPVGGEWSMDEGVVLQPEVPAPALSMWRALWLPGVVEVSISYAALKVRGRNRNRRLFVSVCVSRAGPHIPTRPITNQQGISYGLFFWLPTFLSSSFGLSTRDANLMSMLFDAGQLTGSPTAGLLSSKTRRPHLVNCLLILAAALPIALLYAVDGKGADRGGVGVLLFLAGAFSGGPQNLLATAICQEIGSSGRSGGAAVARVASVVDGIGSLGAAVVQMLVGHLATCRPKDDEQGEGKSCELDGVFILLVAGSLLASFALVRLAVEEHRAKRSSRAAVAIDG